MLVIDECMLDDMAMTSSRACPIRSIIGRPNAVNVFFSAISSAL